MDQHIAQQIGSPMVAEVPGPSLLTVKQVAGLLAVSQTAVYDLCHAGILPYFKVGARGGRYRFYRDDVEKYLRRQRHEQATVPYPAQRQAAPGVTTGFALLRSGGWEG